MEASSAFLTLLEDFNVRHLDSHPAAVYGIWANCKLAFMNRAWSDFFSKNGGAPERWTLGADLMDAVPASLRPFYAAHYDLVLSEQRPWEHVYECSSHDEVRQFHMLTFPLRGRQGLLIINSLQYAAPRNSDPVAASGTYADPRGIVTQCSHCRRVRVPQAQEQWDWVPSLVQSQLPNISHGLCPSCFAFHYMGDAHGNKLVQPKTTIDKPSAFARKLLDRLRSEANGELKPLLTSADEAFYSGFGGGRVR